MSEKHVLAATVRTIDGKKVRSLRAMSLVPANITSGSESVKVSVGAKEFIKLYAVVGDSSLFYIDLAGESSQRPVLVSEAQIHPVTSLPIHVVFRQVSLKEKVVASVPVVTVGELKLKNGVVVMAHSEVEVEALPLDLPEKFEVDLSKLTEIGQSVTFMDLEYDRSKVTLKVAEEQLNEPIVLIQEVKEEKPEPVVESVVAEGAASAEGAAPGATAGAATAGATAPAKGDAAPDAKSK